MRQAGYSRWAQSDRGGRENRGYDSIVAGSGTYILEGTTLTMTAILHKNPSEMTANLRTV